MGMPIDEKCYLYGSCKCQTAACVVRPNNGCPVYRYFKNIIVKDQYEARKNDLGVDCRSLKDIKELVERKADALDGVMLDAGGVIIGLYFAIANDLPSATPQEPRKGYCKDCKYFEYNSMAKVDGIPLIVAHEICSKWGNGCKTSENGYCFLFEPKADMREVEE